MRKKAIFIVLLIYYTFSLATLFSWNIKGINTVTGDEPHYLVISSGIVNQGTLEQTAPYREEFKLRKIYTNGLAPEDAQPSPENTHGVLGPNGLFNVHNIGLPLLLSVPFLLGGIIGAKLIMVFFGSLVVVTTWKFSSYFSENEIHRLWVVIATTISLPLIPASNQIYPDILAGLITVAGLYWFFSVQQRRSLGLEALLATMIVFLPWLQIKFAVTCAILILSIVTKIYFHSKNIKKIIWILAIASASCSALAAYNYYAFGKISGPYQSGALEISKTSLMVLLGLGIDQNQGFILQNPINLIGVIAVGWMYKFNRSLAIVWMLAFLSLIVPNALHPTWYGGWSVSGRFQWAAALLFIIPTVYGLLDIARKKNRAFSLIIISGIIFQIYCFYLYSGIGVNVYNKHSLTWFDNYSIFHYPFHGWLPMLYNADWAYTYLPNYSWLLLIGFFLISGFLINKNIFLKTLMGSKYIFIFYIILISVVLSGAFNNKPKSELIFKADRLPSQVGQVIDSYRYAEYGIDKPGFLNYGPYFPLRKGDYEVDFSYKSSSNESIPVGWMDVYNSSSGLQLINIPINGTDGATVTKKINFKLTQSESNFIEFRTYWNGVSDIELQEIFVRGR
jgi:hypothetical protein